MARLATVFFLKDAAIDLSGFESRCRWRRFDPNEILVDFDDHSTDVFFLMTGEVRILIRTQAGKEVILGEMRGGQMFGELAAIDGVSRSANVTGLTRGEVCVMPASVFREIVFTAPAIADRLLHLLTRRVRELNGRLMEHAVLDLRHRLYSELPPAVGAPRQSAERAGGDAAALSSRAGGPHRLPARAGHPGVHDDVTRGPRRAHSRCAGDQAPGRLRGPHRRGDAGGRMREATFAGVVRRRRGPGLPGRSAARSRRR
jgi:CRP-like cAMP-binding protein